MHKKTKEHLGKKRREKDSRSEAFTLWSVTAHRTFYEAIKFTVSTFLQPFQLVGEVSKTTWLVT